MSQTTYAEEFAQAQLGMLADAAENNIVSRYSDNVAPFGRCVVRDTVDGKVKLPAAILEILDGNGESRPVEGIVVMSQAIEEQPENTLGVADANVPAYPAQYAFSVMRKGTVWVWSEQAVSPTDQVFVRAIASGDEKPGNFRKDADTANAAQLKGARFASTTTGAGLVLLEIDLPQS
jgi:hypothetical protein